MNRVPAFLTLLLLLLAPAGAYADAPDAEAELPSSFEILGEHVAPGERRTLVLAVSESFVGSEVGIPVTVVVGRRAGPTLCLTGGVHGDEVNGIEVVRRLVAELVPERMDGVVIAVPIVNPLGFRRGSRYLPDRRDLNRHFPGLRSGSAASRIAWSFFEHVVRRCDRLLDFHTGSLERTNLPHARADLSSPAVAALTRMLSGWVILHHEGQPGTLRREASDAGIPTLTFEVGGPVRIDEDAVRRTIEGLRGLPGLGRPEKRMQPVEIYARSRWVRVDEGGLLLTRVVPGDLVRKGQVLGVVVDPIASQESEVQAPAPGRILGMASSQVVIPGYAAFHLATLDGEEPTPMAEPPGPEDQPE